MLGDGTDWRRMVSNPADRVTMGAAGELPLEAESLAAPAREGDLVALCRRGDPAAFARLVSLHESMVFNLSARLLGDGEEARDVAQEVFLQVYRTLGRFEGRSSLKTWIYRIVVNQCHNRRRFWHRRGRDREDVLDDTLPAPPSPGAGTWHASPYEQALCHERARRVQQAVLGLRFEQRAVVVLREIEGLSCEEVAAALGIPEGTVKSRLSRAREALREKLLGLIEEGGHP
jgi:RNA polymerase sigma-70 factor (ECF subfamily)